MKLIQAFQRSLFSWCPPSPLPPTILLSHLSQGSLRSEGRCLLETSYIQLCVLRSLSLQNCGFPYWFPPPPRGSFADVVKKRGCSTQIDRKGPLLKTMSVADGILLLIVYPPPKKIKPLFAGSCMQGKGSLFPAGFDLQ